MSSNQFTNTIRELQIEIDKLQKENAAHGFSKRAKELVTKVFSLSDSAKNLSDSMSPK